MDEKPFVSVVMPVRNEAAFIRRSLDAVLMQDYPSQRMEIIIADGLSHDETAEIVKSYQEQHTNIKLLTNKKKYVAPALNQAVREAHGDIIVRVDGHCEIASDYVSQCCKKLCESGADNVGGRMRARGQNYFSEAVAAAMSSFFGAGGAKFHCSEKEAWVDTVYLGAWKREAFEKFGFFDEEMICNQDDEFNYRIRKMGGKILLSPTIQSTYYCRTTLRSLWKQYQRYGFWKIRVMQKHPRQMQTRQFIPALFVGTALFLPILGFLTADAKWPGLFLGIYLMTNLFCSIQSSLRSGLRCFFVLPMIYIVLHISYGVGFLMGLAAFYSRWRNEK